MKRQYSIKDIKRIISKSFLIILFDRLVSGTFMALLLYMGITNNYPLSDVTIIRWIVKAFFYIEVIGRLLLYSFKLIMRVSFISIKKFHKEYFKKLREKSENRPYLLKNLKDSSEVIGNYKAADIYKWVNKICNRLKIKMPRFMFVVESKEANAAITTKGTDILGLGSSLILYSNIFHIFNKKELAAVLTHELAHDKHTRRLRSSIWKWPFFKKIHHSYRRSQEFLADFYGAKYVGRDAMSNALLKIAQRAELIVRFKEKISLLNERYHIDLSSNVEAMVNEIPHFLPGSNEDEKQLTSAVVKVLDKYCTMFDPNLEGCADLYNNMCEKAIGEHLEQFNLKEWQEFDNIQKNNYLEDDELVQLYRYLKGENSAEIFFSDILHNEETVYHPPIKERIIFIYETIGTLKKKSKK